MTTMTFAATPTGDNQQYTDGHNDAHDEHRNGVPLHVIEARAHWYADHAPTGYATGYSNAWAALTTATARTLADDTAWAYLTRAEATR